jgi:2-keto-4-pentenoate hydratase
MARLTAEAIATAADYFAEAVTSGNTLAPFPAELAPTTPAQARRMAARLLAALELPNVGIRLAPRPEGIAVGPAVAGPVLAARLLHAPCAPPPLNRPRATAALVAQLAKPLPARERAWTARELLSRIGTLHVALDVAASRFTAGAPDLACHMADLAGLGAVVFGRPARAGWQQALSAPARARAVGADGAVAWSGMIDARAALLAVADAARATGDLPAGAVLVVAGLSPPLPAGALSLSVTGLGKTEALAA